MNKLFKLIYVNLLNLFDINKIIIAREDGVKSNLEKRSLILVVVNLIYAYFLFYILNNLSFKDNLLVLIVGFIFSTIYCFISDLFVVESMMFKSEDNDILFSYPVSRNQIIVSKMFTVYLKNLLTTMLFMIVTFIVYYLKAKVVSETLTIMYLVVMLTVPLIPIILSTIISYISDYFKTKTHNGIVYKIVMFIVWILFMLLFMLLFNGISSSNMEDIITILINRLYYVYPLSYVFYNMLIKESLLLFVVMIVIPIVCGYLYTLVINNNYLKICSLLKGVKTENKFELKRTVNLRIVGGILRKEFITLFKNRTYLLSSFGMAMIFTVVLCIMCNVVNIDALYSINNMDIYINLYLPTILALMVSVGCSTISSMSLEKSNMMMLRTMPIKMGKILLGKWLINLIIGMVFVFINGTLVWNYFILNSWSIMFSYLIPLLSLLVVSLLGLILDYRFIEKNELEDNAIIKQRLITIVPAFVALVIGVAPFFFPMYKQYQLLLGAYSVVLIIVLIIEGLYLLINKDDLIDNLFR